MKKMERIMQKLESLKLVSHYSKERLYQDALDYISAIKSGRMICDIVSVSKSGMSRRMKFLSCEKHKGGTWAKGNSYYRQYYGFFSAMGYNVADDGAFRVGGCGMDMVFHTNYTVIHKLMRMGFLSRKQCDKLAQQTPTII